MIARTWHGVVPKEKSEAYLDYLRKTGIPDYQSTEGNRGVFVLRREEGGNAHYFLLTLWDSVESIRKFAGDDAEKARYYPKDEEYLLELEPNVTHYEVVVQPGNISREKE